MSLVATAGKVTVVDYEVDADGHLDPNVVVTPGIFCDRLVQALPRDKDIEQRTTRPRPETAEPEQETAR